MTVYYNENDPFAAAWLRELIKENMIAQGDVDERSIKEVKTDDLKNYTQCHFFAGIGVWSYSLRNAGYPDDRRVWTGSCPCQPFSAAGQRGGFDDKRHLWPDWFRLIRESKPDTIFGEQVASKDGLGWFDLVSTDLEGQGYAVGAADLCAAGVGAPHIRQRLYFVAHTEHAERRTECKEDSDSYGRNGFRGRGYSDSLDNSADSRPNGVVGGFWSDCDWLACIDGKARPVEPGTFPLAHGITNRVGLLRGYSNSLVAPQAQAFIEAYLEVVG